MFVDPEFGRRRRFFYRVSYMVSGMGFLGTGVIFKEGASIQVAP